uniref:Putative Chemotaxis protein cheW n=1 Tax=Magnetococcus massalia (strain MO-1) TaxID=451514 RepID=A0A1S7LFU2_MAGMO|nr:putative Chemotaxis protein cheW [Candidatus Magnetococcus massalia]
MSQTDESQASQFLTFKLADEIFGVDIAQVQEVLEYTEITHMPGMPDYMCGVINLRGHVAPVLDLRLKLGMAAGERTINTCIIILEVRSEEETVILGAMADSVQEVKELDPSQTEAPPKLGTKINTDYITAMGKDGNHFIMLLNIERLFGDSSFDGVD